MTLPDAPPPTESVVLRVTHAPGPGGGELEEVEWLAGQGWSAPPGPHHHGDVRYEILGGRVRVVVGAAARIYRAGESVIVPAGAPHALEPIPGHGVHVRSQRWSPGVDADVSTHPHAT